MKTNKKKKKFKANITILKYAYIQKKIEKTNKDKTSIFILKYISKN